ncbi:MAG: A/G-specific adenine glycosylase [Anaerolineaceae bacterium]|nr:A/G-specific adenine glycosylase [Anaerolineaceae bacterium]
MEIAAPLLAWYDRNARELPWRSHPSPYRTWVSEIMLQQTQVETVLPYFERFMARFPTIESLSNAQQSEVLSLWEGLGYYSRARNLHKVAQKVCAELNGVLPDSVNILLTLPGIGRYTAGAIASIAYGRKEAALDANIRRVYSRLLNCKEPLGSSDKYLWQFAETVLPEERAGDFNQALMDLGQAICRPTQPLCLLCPISQACLAYGNGTQNEIPLARLQKEVPHYIVAAAVIQQKGTFLIQRRPQKGLLAGLWEFPGGKLEAKDASLQDCAKREVREELNAEIQVEAPFGIYKHAYTHFSMTLHAFLCQLVQGEAIPESEAVRWVLPANLKDYPMGKVDRLIAQKLARA